MHFVIAGRICGTIRKLSMKLLRVKIYLTSVLLLIEKSLSNHYHSFKNKEKFSSIILIYFILNLSDSGKMYSFKWNIVATAEAYRIANKFCSLCSEVLLILFSRGRLINNISKRVFSVTTKIEPCLNISNMVVYQVISDGMSLVYTIKMTAGIL